MQGWQGGSCAPIQEVIDDINHFTGNNAEVVIVDISHVQTIHIDNPKSSTRRDPIEEEWTFMLNTLHGIKNLFTVERAGGRIKSLQNQSLNHFIGNNQAAVVVLVSDYGNHEKLFERGFWPAQDEYWSLSGMSVGYMQTDFDAVYSTLNPFQFVGRLENNSASVLSLNKKDQEQRFPYFLQRLVEGGYASRIEMDRIQSADQLTFSLANTFRNFNKQRGLPNLIVVYGGYFVTNLDVQKSIENAINSGKSFRVTNDNLGGDPWSGMVKSCAVYYEHNDLVKGRFAYENDNLHFEQDVISIQYGPSQVRNQKVYTNLLYAIAKRETFAVNNESLGGDTQPGAYKTCVVRFRDMNDDEVREVKAGEGKALNFMTWTESFAQGAMGFKGGMH